VTQTSSLRLMVAGETHSQNMTIQQMMTGELFFPLSQIVLLRLQIRFLLRQSVQIPSHHEHFYAFFSCFSFTRVQLENSALGVEARRWVRSQPRFIPPLLVANSWSKKRLLPLLQVLQFRDGSGSTIGGLIGGGHNSAIRAW
jgi:hypothetical protein